MVNLLYPVRELHFNLSRLKAHGIGCRSGGCYLDSYNMRELMWLRAEIIYKLVYPDIMDSLDNVFYLILGIFGQANGVMPLICTVHTVRIYALEFFARVENNGHTITLCNGSHLSIISALTLQLEI